MPGRRSKGCWHGAQWKGTDDGLAAVVLEGWVGAPAAGAYSRNDAATHRTRWTVPLLQRPENQVRSVRGHVQVPCTGLLAGAPHTSKGQGARGTAATTAARHQMSQCWMTTMPSSLRPRDQPGPPQGQTVLGVVPPVLASGEWSCQCAVDSSAPWSTSCRRAGVGRLGQRMVTSNIVPTRTGSRYCASDISGRRMGMSRRSGCCFLVGRTCRCQTGV